MRRRSRRPASRAATPPITFSPIAASLAATSTSRTAIVVSASRKTASRCAASSSLIFARRSVAASLASAAAMPDLARSVTSASKPSSLDRKSVSNAWASCSRLAMASSLASRACSRLLSSSSNFLLASASAAAFSTLCRQQPLYFLPEPHAQGSLSNLLSKSESQTNERGVLLRRRRLLSGASSQERCLTTAAPRKWSYVLTRHNPSVLIPVLS